MLVHICCSVDSHYFLQELQKVYPQENLIGFFYNPNIHPKSEYNLRLNDVKRSCKMLGIELLEGTYDDGQWFDWVKGLEDKPEKGDRCIKCFDIRLKVSAKKAKELREKFFTTTLLSSPMKEYDVLYRQGNVIGEMYGLDFIGINFRKNGGIQKQSELARKDNLYRQNYCGCKFALLQQREMQNKLSLEMISEIGCRKLPGSIEHRQEIFSRRDLLEKNHKNYILTQRKTIAHRILNSRILTNNKIVFSHILAHSESKNYKIKDLLWQYIFVDNQSLVAQTPQKIKVGLSKKDDILFLTLDTFMILTKSYYRNLLDLIHHPPSYDKELQVRKILCGDTSINPIIIVENEIYSDLQIQIIALFQEENVFDVIECV